MIAIGQYTISAIFDGDSYVIQPSVSSVVIEDNGNYSPSEITLNNKHKQGDGTLEDYSGRLKIETTSDNENWETQYTSSSDEVSKTYILPSHISDSEPYHYRKTPVASAGALDEKIVGGTLAWNQLIENGDFASGTDKWVAENTNYATVSASGGVATVTCTKAPTAIYHVALSSRNQKKAVTYGHKLLTRVDVKPSKSNTIYVRKMSTRAETISNATANVWTSIYLIDDAND